MSKEKLRKAMIHKLKNINNENKKIIEQRLLHQLIRTDLWKQARTIGITVSQGFEWDTKSIIQSGWNEGKKMLVPKCIPSQKRLQFYELHHFDQLEMVYYNLLEPNPEKTKIADLSEIDLLIVPGLLFDKFGYRIGFGGGYYDRLLESYGGETVSLVSDMQFIDAMPTEKFDIPVKNLITETGIKEVIST
ncbi:5-formyltetrahydrofolate cyclo-ligase [Ornithinibacillus salinisoli]|uniref:5-formyltetrahydrofolate cyclo-ligase n=1 Tax=Ornithinibacillus salinisoli TaxID=1848459 RepID=A0ABW4W4C7_9BACI